MTHPAKLLAAAAATGIVAMPAVAQYYPQQYPQTYPQQYPEQQYPQQQYPQQYPQQQTYPGYGQPYGYGQNPVTDVIDQLLGNRYSVTDRQAVHRCARAAQTQAQGQYGGGYGYQGGNRGYGQQIAAPSLRVTSITGVERRGNGVRVSGTMSSSYGGQYGSQYAYRDRGYAAGAPGDISFRCNVDYNGQVSNIRIGGGYRRY
jgi:hypothetical protein